MDIKDVRGLYLGLPDSDKQIFLALVSYQLTIHGRGFALDLSESEQVRAFKGLNEIQHQISQHISGLGLGRDRYPDDVLWEILVEKAAAHRLSGCLKSSLLSAGSSSHWKQPM